MTTLSDDKYKKTVSFLTKHVEPKIEAVVNEVNRFLKKQGVRVGLELKWILDETEKEKSNEKET